MHPLSQKLAQCITIELYAKRMRAYLHMANLIGQTVGQHRITADGQWVRVRDRGTGRCGWVSIRQIEFTYGDVGRLPIERP